MGKRAAPVDCEKVTRLRGACARQPPSKYSHLVPPDFTGHERRQFLQQNYEADRKQQQKKAGAASGSSEQGAVQDAAPGQEQDKEAIMESEGDGVQEGPVVPDYSQPAQRWQEQQAVKHERPVEEVESGKGSDSGQACRGVASTDSDEHIMVHRDWLFEAFRVQAARNRIWTENCQVMTNLLMQAAKREDELQRLPTNVVAHGDPCDLEGLNMDVEDSAEQFEKGLLVMRRWLKACLRELGYEITA